jgi:hypothetical protein
MDQTQLVVERNLDVVSVRYIIDASLLAEQKVLCTRFVSLALRRGHHVSGSVMRRHSKKSHRFPIDYNNSNDGQARGHICSGIATDLAHLVRERIIIR